MRIYLFFLCWFLGCFFSPSFVKESPLSPLRFRFIDISMASDFSWFFFVVDDCFVVAVVAVITVVAVVVLFVAWFSVGAIDDFFPSNPCYMGPSLFVRVIFSFRFRAFAR